MKSDLLYNSTYRRFVPGHGVWRRLLTRARFQVMLRTISFCRGDRVLEVGCDEGTLMRMIEQTGAVVHGIDINAGAVSSAQHPHIRQGKAEAIPFPEGSFDICVASHVIEHLKCPQEFLREASRVLVPSGKLVLIYPWELLRGMTVIPDVIAEGYILSAVRMIREYHRHIFTPRLLQQATQGLPFMHIHSRMFLGFPYILPQYVSVFQRTDGRVILSTISH